MLENNEITSVDLLNIFAQRAQSIGQELNLITELTYGEALLQAKKCDELRIKNPEQCKGHLFGIPISVKDMIHQKGYISYNGRAIQINSQPQEKDGLNLYLIKKQGAIPFVRTNVPQCGFTIESVNNVFGRSKNPWDQKKSVGGSSGGEGGLIAARCSPLGLSSDLAGSIRLPASYNGVYGFRPTSSRGILEGHCYFNEIFNGQMSVKGSCGPIGKSVEDLALLFRCFCEKQIIEEQDIDYRNIYQIVKEFDENAYRRKNKVKIGYFKTLTPFDSSLTNQRAVEIAVEKAKELGHQLIEIDIPYQKEIEESCFKLFFSDGIEVLKRMTQGEQLIEEYQLFETLKKINPTLLKLIQNVFWFFGEKRIYNMLEYSKSLTAIQLQIQADKVIKIKNEFLQLFKKHGIEAIICPVSGIPALEHGKNAQLITSLIYCYMWNIVDFPSGVIPVCKVEENELHYNNSRQNDIIAKLVNKYLKQSKGMPVGVQIVGLPNQDEFALNLMKQIDEKICFYNQHQYPL